METNASERKKRCPRCQSVFSCRTENCWCDNLPQIMPLSGNEDCLCWDCLNIEIEIEIKIKATT